MARIPINQFGGIAPSADPRGLPDDGAQVARNLDQRFGDFRPLPALGTAVTTVANATQSLFRTPAGVWLSSTSDVNYVNGQINDSETERVYLTGRSETAEAWQDAAYRQLGVPSPAAAPTTTLVPTDEFTSDEAKANLTRILDETMADVADSLSDTTLGTVPTPDHSIGINVDLTDDGTHWADWFKSETHDIAFHTSEVGSLVTSATGLGPHFDNCYYGMQDESASLPAYAYKNFGIADATTLTFAADFMYDTPHPPGGVVFVGPYRTARFGIQCTDQGEGLSVHIYDEISRITGLPTNGRLWIGTQTSWANRSTRVADVALPVLLDRTVYHLDVAVKRAASGTSTVTVQVIGDGVVIATLTTTGTFAQGDFCGFVVQTDADARGLMPPFTHEGVITYFDNFHVTGSSFSGFWKPYGFDVGSPALPLTAAGDFAYLARMNDDGTAMYNSTEEYLRDSTLGGVAVHIDSVIWYAVPVRKVLAAAKLLDTTTLKSELALIVGPDGVTPILSTDTINSMAADIEAMYNASEGEAMARLRELLTALGTLDSHLKAWLHSGGSSTQCKIYIDSVTAASEFLTTYYTEITDDVRAMLNTRYGTTIIDAMGTIIDRLVETRAYVYTYVTDWGEESAPSLPSELLDVDQNDAVQVDVLAPPDGRNIVGWRLYRSSTSSVGAAYQLIADSTATGAVLDGEAFDYFATSMTGYADSKRQEELQESLQTLTWLEPDARMVGLVGLPNGIMAGFFGKTVCFCEPYYPYAWPIEYQLTVEHNIVGLGVFGQTLVILTEGHPYYASGADSASMSAQKIESAQSCVGKRSIVSSEGGVFFASPDGMCLAGGSGVELLTMKTYGMTEWTGVQAGDGFAAFSEGTLYLAAPGAPDGMLALDFASSRMSSLELDGATAMYTDLLTDSVYVAIGTNVVPLYGSGRRTAVWRSKVFELNSIGGFAWLRLTGILAEPVTVRLYGDGVLVQTLIVQGKDPMRVKSGRWREFEIEMEGASTVVGLTVASSTQELVA